MDKKPSKGSSKAKVQSASAEAAAKAAVPETSIAAQLMAVSFGGQVLGRRIHAVSTDNWRR